MLFMKGTVLFAITMYPLNYGKISVVPFAIMYSTKAIFIVMCPLNYAKISVVPFAILVCTLCLQNSGENTCRIIYYNTF